jgi:hypothetical protein
MSVYTIRALEIEKESGTNVQTLECSSVAAEFLFNFNFKILF